jgi:hypothetical protein
MKTPPRFLATLLLVACGSPAFCQTVAEMQAKENALLIPVYEQIYRLEAFRAALKAPATVLHIADARKWSNARVSAAFSKAAVKALIVIDDYDGGENSRGRMKSALEDAEAEAQTGAEEAELTALKNMALNHETAVDCDLRAQIAADRFNSDMRALGEAGTMRTLPVSLGETIGNHECVGWWKTILRTGRAAVPEGCEPAVQSPRALEPRPATQN